MQVAIVSNGIPVPDSPLLGIFELDQAKALVKQGIDVVLLCIDLRSIRRKRKLGYGSGEIDGIKWYRIAFPLGNVPIELYKIVGRILFQNLYQCVFRNNTRPDLIHAHFYDMGIVAGKLANEKGIPFMITEHSSQVAKQNISRRFKKEIQKGYKSAAKVIAVGEGLREQIKKHSGIDAVVINNVVDTSMYKCIRDGHNGFGFIMTANLISGKNPRLLLEAFARLHELENDCFLGFVGDGDEKAELESRVSELGINDSVTFYGRRTREEFSQIYGHYDCFVLPSNAETFGVVIIEAFACGLPCISTKCGGPEYIINKTNGLVVSIKSEDELLSAMKKMKNNRKNYDSKLIIKYVKDIYSEEVVGSKLLKLYSQVVEMNEND